MGKKSWNIEEIIDFEACVHRFSDDFSGDQLIRNNIAVPLLETHKKTKKSVKKKLIFREWKNHRVKDYTVAPSSVWSSTAHVITLLLLVAGLLFGVSAVVAVVDWSEKSINIGTLIGVTVFLPWLLLILSSVLFFLGKGKLGWATLLMRWIMSKISARLQKKGVSLPLPLLSLEKPVKMFAFNTLQKASMAYGVGSVAAIIALVYFIEIQFFWESTVAGQMHEFWFQVVNVLSLPWSWSGFAVPTHDDVLAIRRTAGGADVPAAIVQTWAYFLILCVVVWSLLPRVIMLILGKLRYFAALHAVQFEEKRHRQLWRRLYVQPVQTDHAEEEDGAVLIDYGGIGIEENKLRPFILQRLRLNPTKVQLVRTLDTAAEAAAYKLIGEKQQAVILCCEATEFSPKSLEAVIKKIKFHGKKGEMIHVLLLGNARFEQPSEERIAQWRGWIDELADTEVDLTVIDIRKTKEDDGRG